LNICRDNGIRCPDLRAALRRLSAVSVFVVLALLVMSAIPAPVEGAPPVADAGQDQTVYERTYVTLDASASLDDVGITNYTWVFFYGGINRTLYGMVNDSFRFMNPGVYNVTLTVTDVEGGNATDTVMITVLEKKVSVFVAYWLAFLTAGVLVFLVVFMYLLVTGRFRFVSEPTREKASLMVKRLWDLTKQLVHHRMGIIGIVILVFFFGMAAFGPMLAPYPVDMEEKGPFVHLLQESKDHWMGTDDLGFDIFSQLLYGARTSIIVGIFAAIIASVLGAAVGLYSGFVGGWKDEAIMRLNDVILSIPWLVLMILFAAMLGEISLMSIIVIIGVTGWSGTARLVRAQVMSLRERQYIERARCIGSGNAHIINKHILPNAFPLVFANTILTVAVSILSEATLSFLKMRPEGTVTWGTMLSYAEESSAIQHDLIWWIVAPGLCIVFLVLGFTLLGHALDEITNPRLRRR